MKIDRILGNPAFSVEAMTQEIEKEFPNADLTAGQLEALSTVRLLRITEKALLFETDVTSHQIADSIAERLNEIQQDQDYFDALKRIDRRP